MRTLHKTLIGSAVAASIVIGGAVPYLKQDEGYSEMPYFDIAHVLTDCWGRTGPKVRPGVKTSQADCTADMVVDVQKHYYEPLKAGIPGFETLPKDTQISVVRISYNVGVAGVVVGTIGRQFRAGNFKQACEAFMLWDKARVNGILRSVKGLTSRREREMAQCLSGLSQAGILK